MTGSCLCGSVAFRISGPIDTFFACHCSRCRKDTGSAFAATLFSTTAQLVWLSGRECVRSYRVPDTRHQRSFCKLCGSALPDTQSDGTLLVVPAGSLDDPVGLPTPAHICMASRAAWDVDLEHCPRLDGLPS